MSGIMSTTVSPSTSPSSDSDACVVNETYYPHLFLIPAAIIIVVLAFLRRRRSFKTDVWGGRPGLVVPIDFLGFDRDRLGIMFAFGAATASIMGLVLFKFLLFGSGRDPWEKAFLIIGISLEIAFLYYPYFACLASYHRIIGAMMGLPYVMVFFLVQVMVIFQRCHEDKRTWAEYVESVLALLPIFLCHLFILVKFVIVLYTEIRNLETCALKLFFRQEEQSSSHEVKLVRPWLRDHVKNLIKPKVPPEYSGIVFILRKIYNPKKNFKFSTQTVSVVMVCGILLYSISIEIVFFASYGVDIIRKTDARGPLDDFWHELLLGFYVSSIAATILVVMVCVVSLVRFMENHKKNMLRMFRGDKSFIPRIISVSQFMIGSGLKYNSFQIGYFLLGYFLLLLLFLIICGFFYLLRVPFIRDWIVSWMTGVAVLGSVAFVTRLSLPLASFTIFRDYSYPKDVISINNRNVYSVFSYVWFFVGLPMGFFSAVFRILKAMAIGALMLPRIDYSIIPDGFQWIDAGLNAYIGYLHVQAAYRNPVLRVFCQILCDDIRDRWEQKWKCSPQARNRWFLALTLIRNPQLAWYRKHDMQAETPKKADYRKPSDIEIEVRQNGADNSGLIQDK